MKKIYTFLILFFILIFSENLFARPISRWFFSNDFQGPIFITEISAAKADKTNWGQIWIKDTTPNEFWFTDDAGTDFQLGVTATAWDDIGNPDAASEIDMGAYITEFNVQDFRIGDGGSNYVKFSATGMTFVGTYGITADWDFADASTVAAAVGEFRYDNAATGMDGGALNFHNGTEVKYLLDYATLPTADGQFPIYDETSDKFVPLAMSGHATMTETGAVSLAVNSVDSDQYVDGSIDIAHMSTDSVDYDNTTGSYKVAVLVGDPDSWTLTTALHYGGTLIASAAGEDTLDAIAVGMSLTLQADDTIAAIFNPNSSDTIILNGVSLAQGEALISDDTAGTFSIGVCQYRAANTWDCSCSDGMTEETP